MSFGRPYGLPSNLYPSAMAGTKLDMSDVVLGDLVLDRQQRPAVGVLLEVGSVIQKTSGALPPVAAAWSLVQ